MIQRPPVKPTTRVEPGRLFWLKLGAANAAVNMLSLLGLKSSTQRLQKHSARVDVDWYAHAATAPLVHPTTGTKVYLMGTNFFSNASSLHVAKLLNRVKPRAVAIGMYDHDARKI